MMSLSSFRRTAYMEKHGTDHPSVRAGKGFAFRMYFVGTGYA